MSGTNYQDPAANMEPRVDVRDLLNAQAGRIPWTELQRHFARGAVLVVGPELDLIDVAARLTEDNKKAIQAWMDRGQLADLHGHGLFEDAVG